ncbi:MAG: hypothetical protein RLZZ200_2864, partial [Pseudomonadota bacterium]
GALKWWYQVSPEDWVDLDMASPPVLYRARGVRDLLVFGGKDGHVTAVDRDTHQRVFHTPVTTIEKAPRMPTKEGTRMCPGFAGGVEWNGPALDRRNNLLVTGAVDACFIVKLGKTEYGPEAVSYGGSVEPVGETTGWVTAIDADTGAVRWKYHAEKPVLAGVTPTAGGVTFTGDLAGNLLVFDSASGVLVHKHQTGGALAGGVVTYEQGGTQYLAFANGNVSRNAFGALGLPSVVIMAVDGKPASGRAAGQGLYNQVCVSCHGPDGAMLADHRLGTLSARQDLEATIRAIKDPKPPMPRLYPDLLDDKAVADVAAYLREELK